MTGLTLIILFAILGYSATKLSRITDNCRRKLIIEYFKNRGYEVFDLEGGYLGTWFSGTINEHAYKVELLLEGQRLSRWFVNVPLPYAYFSDRYIRFVEIPPQMIEVAEDKGKTRTDLDCWDRELDGPR